MLALIALSTARVAGDPEAPGWSSSTAPRGVHGASYRLSDRFSTSPEDPKWSQRPRAP